MRNPTIITAGIFIALAGLIIYGMSLKNAFVLDDISQIVRNNPVHDIRNLPAFFTSSTFNSSGGNFTGIYYKPLMLTFFSAIYTIFGQNPFPYHAFQLMVHITNAILVFALLTIFLAPGQSWVSLALACIFLVHPAQSESVLFISALQEPLFFFFGITAFLVWISPRKNFVMYSVTVILLLLSLFSKETGVLFLILVPLYSFLYRKKFIPSVWVTSLTFILYGIFRIGIAHLFFGTSSIIGPIAKLPLWARLFNVPYFFLSYLKFIFFPKDIPISSFSVLQSLTIFNVFIPLMIGIFFFWLVISLGMSTVRSYPRNRTAFRFFFIWFVIGLGMHLQLIPLDEAVSPRWLYFPLVGLLGMAGIITGNIHSKKVAYRNILLTGTVITLIVLSIRTYARTFNFRDEYTLISHDVQLNPGDYSLQNLFAIALTRSNRLEEAQRHAEQSIHIYPNALNWNTLGTIYFRNRDIDRAIDAYTTSIRYGTSIEAYLNLSGILLINRSPQISDSFIKKALERFPGNPDLWIMSAIAQSNLGNQEGALASAKKANELRPSPVNKSIYDAIIRHQPMRIPYSFE